MRGARSCRIGRAGGLRSIWMLCAVTLLASGAHSRSRHQARCRRRDRSRRQSARPASARPLGSATRSGSGRRRSTTGSISRRPSGPTSTRPRRARWSQSAGSVRRVWKSMCGTRRLADALRASRHGDAGAGGRRAACRGGNGTRSGRADGRHLWDARASRDACRPGADRPRAVLFGQPLRLGRRRRSRPRPTSPAPRSAKEAGSGTGVGAKDDAAQHLAIGGSLQRREALARCLGRAHDRPACH